MRTIDFVSLLTIGIVIMVLGIVIDGMFLLLLFVPAIWFIWRYFIFGDFRADL